MLILVEVVLSIVVVIGSLVVPDFGAAWVSRAEAVFRGVAERKTFAVWFVAFIAIMVRMALLPILPLPTPKIDDEQSYLLLADTLLHGRLTNPTHPMWQHFDTIEVNMIPTYASVYPPVQGMFLAVGKLLSGSAFFGVMLGVAIMCGAICWMLQAWMGPRWALLGGLLAIMRFGTFSYWADSYMGGAPAAIGGALLLGAFARIKQEP